LERGPEAVQRSHDLIRRFLADEIDKPISRRHAGRRLPNADHYPTLERAIVGETLNLEIQEVDVTRAKTPDFIAASLAERCRRRCCNKKLQTRKGLAAAIEKL
jgi:hypothetical protein